MAEQQHTPGPWFPSRAELHVRKAYNATGDGPKDFNVCAMNDALPDDERAANARLIAAAPDLLFACRVAVGILFQWDNIKADEDSARALFDVESAIAKATGGGQ